MTSARRLAACAALGLVACASTRPATTHDPSPAPSAMMVPPAEETLPPDVVRCGVDDAPVPVGKAAGFRDLRLALLGQPLGIAVAMPEPSPSRAMLPTVELKIVGENLGLPELSLVELFSPCAEQAQPTDAGEIGLGVSFGSSGAPRTSRPAERVPGAGPSPFARCLAERACRLPATAALAGKATKARVSTTFSPPVFRGRVQASYAFIPTKPGKNQQRPSKPVEAAIRAISGVVEGAGLLCAKRLPPADDVFFQSALELTNGKPPTVVFQPMADHAEVLRTCIEAELTRTLASASAQANAGKDGGASKQAAVSALFNLSLQIIAEASPPPPAHPAQ